MRNTDLLAAWDDAHDALKHLAKAARQRGDEAIAREAETIADAMQSRVTALSKIAREKQTQSKHE